MIVVEASAMVHALVDDLVSPGLLASSTHEDLHASAMPDFGVAGALRGAGVGRQARPGRADDAVGDFTAMRIERYPVTHMLGCVLDLRDIACDMEPREPE